MLLDAGTDPIVMVSHVDEEALTAASGDIAPAELALILARAKAQNVQQTLAGTNSPAIDPSLTPEPVIVGCDSVFELDGVAYGKPLTAPLAIERITAMSGRSGLLHTGHWVIRGDHQIGRTTTTEVEFAPLSADEIAGYVATGEPLAVAGAFTLDGHAAPYVRRIVGDPSNVLGISLPTMRELIAEIGLEWQVLWTPRGASTSR